MSYPLDLDVLAQEIHETACDKGFWDHETTFVAGTFVPNPSIFEEKIALIMTEAGEMLEARRDEDEAGEREEWADTMIRLLDYAAARQWTGLHQEISAKMGKNRDRPVLHGRKR